MGTGGISKPRDRYAYFVSLVSFDNYWRAYIQLFIILYTSSKSIHARKSPKQGKSMLAGYFVHPLNKILWNSMMIVKVIRHLISAASFRCVASKSWDSLRWNSTLQGCCGKYFVRTVIICGMSWQDRCTHPRWSDISSICLSEKMQRRKSYRA